MRKKYKYVLFDWNGTIIDDLDANIEIANGLLEEYRLAPLSSREFYLDNFSFPIKSFYEKCGFDFSKIDYGEICKKYIDAYNRKLGELLLFPDARQTFELLKENGIELAIISASEEALLNRQVKKFEIESFFKQIIGTDNNKGSGKIDRVKNWFEQKGALSDEVVFVGDTVHDCHSAEAIGCDCFLVSRGHNGKRLLEKTKNPVFETLLDAAKEIVK